MIRVSLLISSILYFLSLAFAYEFFMLRVWGEDFLEVSWGTGAQPVGNWIGVLSCLFLCLFASVGTKSIRSYLSVLPVIAPVGPMCVILAFKGEGIEGVLVSLVGLVLIRGVSSVNVRLPRIAALSRHHMARKMSNAGIVIGLVIVGWCIVNGSLAFLNFNFSRVYEFRGGAATVREGVFEYLFLNYVGVGLSVAVAFSVVKRRLGLILLLLFLNVLIFGITSNKLYLFVTPLALAIYWVSTFRNPMAATFVLFSVLAGGLTTVCLIFPSTEILGTLFLRRYLFVPAYANLIYFDFFSSNPYYYWATSRLSLGLVQSGYDVTPPALIAEAYSGVAVDGNGLANNMNTGFIGAGYGHAGVVGVWLYSILIGGLISIVEVISGKVGFSVTLASTFFFFFTILFTSSDFATSMLTYGGGLLILMAFLFRGENRFLEGASLRRF